jgi:hypothetical protein
MKTAIFHSIWLGVAGLTAAVYLLPVPLRPTLLLLLGVVHGWFLARYF